MTAHLHRRCHERGRHRSRTVGGPPRPVAPLARDGEGQDGSQDDRIFVPRSAWNLNRNDMALDRHGATERN